VFDPEAPALAYLTPETKPKIAEVESDDDVDAGAHLEDDGWGAQILMKMAAIMMTARVTLTVKMSLL